MLEINRIYIYIKSQSKKPEKKSFYLLQNFKDNIIPQGSLK